MGNKTHEPIVNRLDEAAQQTAVALGETEPVPLRHIRCIIQTLGPDGALQLLDQAIALEAQGRLMLLDGRRTPVVFFRLVRENTTADERGRIWPSPKKPKPKAAPNRDSASQ